MSEKWYYVLAGERQGPVDFEQVHDLFTSGKLKDDDYVWRKGLANWIKIKDAEEFVIHTPLKVEVEEETPLENMPSPIVTQFNLAEFDRESKTFYIKTGADRGQAEVEYGPFSINILKKLYEENRINAKTFIFTKGMDNWKVVSDLTGFEEVFDDVPPAIEEKDKRSFKRKPLIARMFIQNNQHVFEGICRDVSIGGMQVLVDNFPGKVGEEISINVHPENTDHHFVAAGKIVRLLEGSQGFSFRFFQLNSDATIAINSYISEE